MNERLFIIFIANTVNNYASRGWIFKHFNDSISNEYDIKIFDCEPTNDKGIPLEIFVKKQKCNYKRIYLISTNTDKQNDQVNWKIIKKYIDKLIIFPIDAISVLSKFKNTILKEADLVWCPHIQKLEEIEKFNKPVIYLPYASNFPKIITPFEKRSDSLFFQGNSHGLRKSLVGSLVNKTKINVVVQGNGWEVNEKGKNIKSNSIKESLNYYFGGSLKDIFNKLIKNSFSNKYLLRSVLNYPNRLIRERVVLKNNNLKVLNQNNQKNIDDFKYTLGINFLFSNQNYFSYRLRDFEAPSFGSCHFTQSDPNLEKIFLPNTSMIYYRDSNDLIELINYYLVSSDGRKKSMEIAKNARKIAKNNTWISRLDKIKDFFEE